MKKIVMTGGGTAGHVTPNIALMPALKEKGYQISYIGSYDGIERGLIEAEGIPYWEPIVGYRTLLNSGLVIYPTVNMIENVGTSANATHAPKNIRQLPKSIQKMFTTRAENIQMPLKHPPYVIEDTSYFNKQMKQLYPSFFAKLARKIERLFRIIFVR